MLETIGLGVLSSIAAEVVTWINKKLTGTVLAGDGAFLLATALALVGAGVKEALTPGFHFDVTSWSDWQALGATFSETFTIAQVYFLLIAQKLGLEVTPKKGDTVVGQNIIG